MEIAFVVVLVLAALAAVAIRFGRARRPPAPAVSLPIGAHGVIITLEVGPARADHPSVVRLARDAAATALARDPTLDGIEVRNQAGIRLALFPKGSSGRVVKEIALPRIGGIGRHAPVPRPRSESEDARPALALPRFVPPDEPRANRSFAETLELPVAVRDLIRNVADAVDVVRAILEVSGRRVIRDGDLLLCGDDAVIVVGSDHDSLNHAYLQYRGCGARHGTVIATGILNPREVTRREMMVPELRHAGVEAVQRMADAAAIGVDPLRFVLPPQTVAG